MSLLEIANCERLWLQKYPASYLSQKWPDFGKGQDDSLLETELSHNPYSVQGWVQYVKRSRSASSAYRILLYLRGLGAMPLSWKLWREMFDEMKICLAELEADVRQQGPDGPLLLFVDLLFRRALASLPKLPGLHLRYCAFLYDVRKKVTLTRRAYDRALASLPITQHHLIWEKYIPFILSVNIRAVTVSTLRRYVQLDPSKSEVLLEYLIQDERYDEAALLLGNMCVDEQFQSILGKNRSEMWLNLCFLLAQHPSKIKSVDGEQIIKSAITQFADCVASLWCCLATYCGNGRNIRCQCAIYDEALDSVYSLEDFNIVYSNYGGFLRIAAEHLVEMKKQQPLDRIQQSNLDFALKRLEKMVERRAELVSAVRIRRDPDDVGEWVNRVRLLGAESLPEKSANERSPADVFKVLKAFSEAVRTINPLKSKGQVGVIWIQWAKFYEKLGDLENAREVLARGCEADHKTLDSLVGVWCERVELELRQKDAAKALQLARMAVQKSREHDSIIGEPTPKQRQHRSVRLWSLCADMEENFGTRESLKACYSAMFDAKVITVSQIIAYAAYLEGKRYYEEAFQLYERGLHFFQWPHALDLWLMYLSKFVSRYGARKVDRARNLFEEAVKDVPQDHALTLYFMYAKFEEHFGMIRGALTVLHRATKKVPDEDKVKVFKLLIALTAEHYGATRTRPIFEEALRELPDEDIKPLGLKFSAMEAALLEVDRARSILEHVSQFCNPQRDQDFWAQWKQFEVQHGDEESYREMLRKRRAVATHFDEAKRIEFDEELLAEVMEAEKELEEDKKKEPDPKESQK